MSEPSPKGWVVVSQAKTEEGSPCPLLGLFTCPTSQWSTPAPTWHLWLLTPYWPCPMLGSAGSSRLGHSVFVCVWPWPGPFSTPLPPHWFWQLTGSPPSWGARYVMASLSSQFIRKHFFPNSFYSKDNNAGSMQVCVCCVVSGCVGNHFWHSCIFSVPSTPLGLVGVVSRRIMLAGSSHVASCPCLHSGWSQVEWVMVPTCFSPGYTSSCWIPLSLWINAFVLLTGLQLLFSECHGHIWGFLWKGAAGSTIHLFIRMLSYFEKQFEREKWPIRWLLLFSSGPKLWISPLPLVYRIPIWLGTLIYVGCNPERLIWFILRSFILRNFWHSRI